MAGLFGSKRHEESQAELKHTQQAESGNQYGEMVTKALERLTHWAFPDSQIERVDATKWQLWHTTDAGEKYVDVKVELRFKKDTPESFWVEGLDMNRAELNREDLDETLRRCICSIS